MRDYSAPLRDMQFVLRELAPLDEVTRLPGCGDVTLDVADAILQEAGKLAAGVLSPLNASGDREGARAKDGEVFTATGWRDAYRQFVDGGWNALSCDPEHGGQGVPRLVSALVEEMWNGANVSFALCPMLTRGAIEAIELCGSEALKRTYLPKLISGRVGRHDGADRAPGGLGPRRGAHARGAARRRHLPAGRSEDLHHVRRTRSHREHRPPRARAAPRRAGGREGHLALRRAQVPARRGRAPGRAQRRPLRVARAQARDPREPDRDAGLRRQGRRRGVARGRGEPRPRVHVRHDERRALLGRARGHRPLRARLPARRWRTRASGSRAPSSAPGVARRSRSFATPTSAAC